MNAVMNKEEADVAVIGGGPAGATAARLLARSGKDTVLVEKDLDYDKPCGGGITSSVFSDFDLPGELIKKEVRLLRIIAPSGHTQEVSLEEASLAIVQRKQFDRALRDLSVKEGARLLHGRLKTLRPAQKKWLLDIDTPQGPVTLQAARIVAADGVNSRVRQLVCNSLPARLFCAYSLVETLDMDHCEFRFGTRYSPGYYSWIFPACSGASIGTASVDSRKARHYLDNCLKAKGIVEGKAKGYFIPLWQGDLYEKKGVFFIGDAAGQVMPMSFEGIYYAMKAGQFVHEAIVLNKPALYKKLFLKRFKKRFLFMKALQAFFLKNDASAERLVRMHSSEEVRRLSLNIWLGTEEDKITLRAYTRILGNIIRSYQE